MTLSLDRPRVVPFAANLAAYGDAAALLTADGQVSYAELAARVDAVARRFTGPRRLVLLAAANTVDSVVGYLAALAAGQPLLVVAGDNPRQRDAMIAAYDPDVVLYPAGGGLRIDERRTGSAHLLHPELALLLSTSGSTGSPKLVRLSQDNVQANAEAIADYLGIRASDRAATTLPLHYCYGLSVLHSHLLRGAGVILTGLSVVDPCFWDLFRRYGGTSFAGVPYTFELLERSGFADRELPTLRYVTQAGGRLDPALVRRYATLGPWDFVVMYGQTEATARMAYLPPSLAAAHPDAIGVPVPGGSFRLDPVPECSGDGVGELVYAGPNVMLGYAAAAGDLARGRDVEELRTGDLARRTGDGLFQVVGRRSRFAKVYGQRIDLDHVELLLAARGLTTCCAGTDQGLVVAVESDPADRVSCAGSSAANSGAQPAPRGVVVVANTTPVLAPPPPCEPPPGPRTSSTTFRRRTLASLIADECGVPIRTVTVVEVRDLPRLPTGKPDYPAVLKLAGSRGLSRASGRGETPTSRESPGATGLAELRALYAELLDCPDVTDADSFVALGGDSLSYVELSVRLERLLGRLPDGWHTMPLAELHAAARPRRRWVRMLETTVALRAVAIVLIVGTHVKLFALTGGAHLLFGVAGFNLARFQLVDAPRAARVRHLWAAIRRIALPSMLWITGALLLTRDYGLPNAFLLNSLLGPRGGRVEWHFWFVEALVYILVGVALLLAVPAVDRWERRYPFGLPVALLAAGLVMRFDLLGIADRDIPSALRVFWLFALGWAAAKAVASGKAAGVSGVVGVSGHRDTTTTPEGTDVGTWWRRLAVSAAVVATVPGFFPGQPLREAIVIGGMLLMIWVPALPGLPGLNQLAGVLAASSLYIYVTHWQVFRPLDDYSRPLAFLASLIVGIVYGAAIDRLAAALRRWRTRRAAEV
ncbi:MAG: AMP-binding protein [Micromonosporaceae bacterium]